MSNSKPALTHHLRSTRERTVKSMSSLSPVAAAITTGSAAIASLHSLCLKSQDSESGGSMKRLLLCMTLAAMWVSTAWSQQAAVPTGAAQPGGNGARGGGGGGGGN